MQTLRLGYTLRGGRYRIERVLGQGGFGITYLVFECGTARHLAIKEFFMKELCGRDESTGRVTCESDGSREKVARFRRKFFKEASNIARLSHPHIVRVYETFEENNTVYYVMEYAEGGSLEDLVRQRGCLSEADAVHYISQVADALAYIHGKKMNHLDVKPANILLNKHGEALLIDFGLSKQYDVSTGSQTSTTPVGISEGYAPIEQYRQGGVDKFSPKTDIYALGATFFKLLTGKTPPSASEIFESGFPLDELKEHKVSQVAIKVIRASMKPRKKDRMKDVYLFVDGLTRHSSDSDEVAHMLDSKESNVHKAVVERQDSGEATLYLSEKEASTPKKKERKRQTAPRQRKGKSHAGKLNESNDVDWSAICTVIEVIAFVFFVMILVFACSHGFLEDIIMKKDKHQAKAFFLLVFLWVRRLYKKLFG